MQRTIIRVLGLLVSLTGICHADEELSFVRDVIPVLTKAGCNAGKCHGSFQGRGGLRLSLLGFDPMADYEVLTKEHRGRRVSPAAPEQSLLLLKGTATVPHGGGQRFEVNSRGYKIVRDYIAQGLPAPTLPLPHVATLEIEPRELVLSPGTTASLAVQARWPDGTSEPVTEWTLFDSANEQLVEVSSAGVIQAVRAGKSAIIVRFLGQVALVPVLVPYGKLTEPLEFTKQNYIDELVAADWEAIGVEPTPLASDSEFIRRVFLDLIGTLPTAAETRDFLDSADPDKRRKLIDAILDRPEYVDFWTWKWSDLLRAHRRYLGDRGLESFTGWIRQSVRANRPLDAMARELLTAQGNLFTSGPVAFYFVDSKPEELAETTAQVFLGVRLQCARCHHHPFEVWSQADYRGLSAFFTNLETKDLDQSGRFGGARILRAVSKPVAARRIQGDPAPRVLNATADSENSRRADESATHADIRQELADWVTSPDNPYFARNFANRLWKQLFGRGIVEPVDDMRVTNPASNDKLLDALAQDLVEHQFDMKHLLRSICNSSVYQRASELGPERDIDGALFTHRRPQRLSAEVLLDAINSVTNVAESFPDTPAGTRAIALPDPTVVSPFLMTFGRPDRSSACECARLSQPDLAQTLHLINNPGFHEKLTRKDARLGKLLETNVSDTAIAEELYLAAFARRPTVEEHATIKELLASAPSRQEGWEDVFWALLNCSEFVFNH